MTDPGRHLHPSPLSAPPPEDDAPPWGVWLSRLALLIGLAVVVARVTSVEMLREPFEVQPAGQSAPRGAGPATGVVLDLLAAVPALLVLLRRALDRSFALRFTWAFVPMALLAAWTVLSSTWAGDRFAAAVGASHWAAALALLWAAAQLVTTGRRARLVAGACLGLLTVLSVHGLTYRWQELPELRRGFQEQKAAFFRERGWEPGSFAARQYEQKVMNGEMIGFSASANTFAALLVVTMVVAAGLGVERARDGAGVPLAVAVVVGVGFWVNCYTNSRAALATPVLAAAAFAACGVAGRHLRRFGTPLYLAGVLAFAAVVLFLVQHGARTGTLFHDSLNFRWRYWVGGWRVLLDRPLLGVGWDNFGANYLAKRLPIASEEVRDPHNLLVRAFAELGVIGGGLMLAWLLLLAWRVTRPKPDAPLPQVAAPPGLPHDEPTPIRVLAAPVAIAVCGIGLSAIASIDFAQAADYVSLELMKRGLFALLMLGGLAVAAARKLEPPASDDRPAPWVVTGLVIGVGVFLLHNLIDFSLFEPAGMFLFALVAGSAVAASLADRPPRANRAVAVAGLVVAGAAWVAAAVGFAGPVLVAEGEAAAGDAALRARSRAVVPAYDRAAAAVPYNADYPYRAARAVLFTGGPPAEARRRLEAAIATDPTNIRYRLTLAQFALRQPTPDRATVRGQYDAILSLDPNNVDLRLEYAHILETFGDRPAALAQYRAALAANAGLSPDEPKRLPPERLRVIEERVRDLER